MSAVEWRARWIAFDTGDAEPGRRPVVHLRREFEVGAAFLAPRLRITAHGIYQAFIDGERIGDHELTPGYTEYGHRLQFQEFDLALAPGTHTLAVELSDGWYRGQVGLYRHADQWGEQTALLAQLDGTDLVTDASWRARTTSHTADLIAGETIDLRDTDDWMLPGYDDSGWGQVTVEDRGDESLVPQEAPPVRRIEELAPRSIRRLGQRQIIDFGQNIAGWTRLTRLGPAGAAVTLTHAEALTPEGDVTQVNLAPDIPALGVKLPAGQIDTIISAGTGSSFEPRHSTRGFRYVAVDGLDEELQRQDVTAIVVHTDLHRTGTFTCSDEALNRLHEAAVWSFRGNAIDIPTDCPVRERAGWTGDWQIFVPTAAYLYDVADFSAKWLRDVAAGQWPNGVVGNFAPMPRGEGRESPGAFMNGSAGWGDACVIVPWELYLAYGDPAVLEEAWAMMLRWIENVRGVAESGRHPNRTGPVLEHERYLWDSGFHFGEWLVPEPSGDFDFGALMAADKGDTATAYYRHSTRLLAQIAGVLARHEEAAHFAELSERIRSAWQTEYLDADGRVHPATQANCVRALAFDLVDDPQPVVAQLVSLIEEAGGHLATGFLATPHLLPVLAEHGRADVAFRVLMQRTWPSWLGMIDRGATTMWERWEGYSSDGMPFESHNHYSKGAVISFLHRQVAGIRPVSPGYRRIRIEPLPGHLVSAEGRLETPLGEVASSWTVRDGTFELAVTVPTGATAEIVLPDGARHEVEAGAHAFRAGIRADRRP